LHSADAVQGFHRNAAATQRELGDHWHLAIALDGLAIALHQAGEADEARQHWDGGATPPCPLWRCPGRRASRSYQWVLWRGLNCFGLPDPDAEILQHAKLIVTAPGISAQEFRFPAARLAEALYDACACRTAVSSPPWLTN
jgi:hypothetical protein